MKISSAQMKAFRGVLSKEDKERIAQHTKKSYRTIEAVLNGDRSNDEIETAVFNRARMVNIALSDAVRAVEVANEAVPMTLEDFQVFKTQVGSDDGEANRLYLETYLQLSHNTFEPGRLMETLKTGHKKAVKNGLYCALLIQKLCGVGDAVAVKTYNDSLKS